jgi:beta-propeller repeat-containing protein/ASPM-SPD-2-Hydin domain-containing protein
MKSRGSVVKLLSYSAVTLLACCLLVAAAFRITGASSRKNISAKTAASPRPSTNATSLAAKAKWLQAYGQLPLSFAENQGQTAQEVRYVSHGPQYDVFLTPQEAVVALRRTQRLDFSPRHRAASLKALRALRNSAKAPTTTALHMHFDGANPAPRVMGASQLPGKVNYFIGNDAKKWHTDIPTYSQVKYTQVYPGVDLLFYGHQRDLEYDFVVAPGADPNAIRMSLAGARKVRVDAHGDVLVSITGGDLRLHKPVVYQNINGRRQEIDGNYAVHGKVVAFAIGAYNRQEPLVVDPVLDYSTYLGGTNDDGSSYAIATDASGDAYIVGQTAAADFPPTSALTPGSNAGGTGFVVELNPAGSTLLYSTYLGSSAGGDFAFGVAFSSGEIYVTGETFGTDFPTAGTTPGFKPSITTNPSGISFLTKLNPSLSGTASLIYSTYLGGNNGDFGNAVAADSTGNAYVTGVTYSTAGTGDSNFAVSAGAYQSTLVDANGSAFLTRIDTTQSGSAGLIYSTFLGGDGAFASNTSLDVGDAGFGVVVDSTHDAYLAGATSSSSAVPFPTTANAFQTVPKTGNVWSSAFISEINTTLSGAPSLVYSTYLGGSGNTHAAEGDVAYSIDLQSGTTVTYVTGSTNSSDFPIQNGFQTTGDPNNGSAFVTLLDTSVGTSLKYSTYLSDTFTSGNSIKADSAGNAYVGGATASTTFKSTTGAFQTGLASGANGDGFIAEISPLGTPADLVYYSYFGGSGAGSSVSPDEVFGLALGTTTAPPTVFIAGVTSSSNFPVTTGAFDAALSAGSTTEGFAASLTLEPTLVISPTSLTFTATAQGTATAPQIVTLTNNTAVAISFTSATITAGVPAAADTDFAVTNTSCGISIPAGMSCTLSVIFTASTSSESATLTIIDGDSSSPQSVLLTGTAPALLTVSPTSLSFNSTAVGTATAPQSVTLTNTGSTAVTFTSATVTSTGGFAADFALAPATTCGASIAASGGSCTVSVTYTPSVATLETATLTLVDSDPSSPQIIALTGTVTVVAPDFTLSASPTSITLPKGANRMSTITVGSLGTFSSAVTLACTGQPRKSTCAISPGSVTPPAGSSANATLTFTTEALVAPPGSPRFLPPVSIHVLAPAFAAALLVLLMFFSARRFRTRLGLAAATLVFVALAGCGPSGTPKGTTTITITGTSGALTHTTTIMVTVN